MRNSHMHCNQSHLLVRQMIYKHNLTCIWHFAYFWFTFDDDVWCVSTKNWTRTQLSNGIRNKMKQQHLQVRGYAKKMRLVNISTPTAFHICHSLNLKGSTHSPGKMLWLHILKVYIMPEIKAQQLCFFSSKSMVCEFYSIGSCSYFARNLWV